MVTGLLVSPRLARLSSLVLAAIFSILLHCAPSSTHAPSTDPPTAQMKTIGAFDLHQDVGGPKLAGNALYNPTDQSYTLSGAGANMWSTLDQFNFAAKKIKGDFIIQATVRFLGSGTNRHRKIGIIARDALNGSSRHAAAVVHGDTLTSLQYRASEGGTTAQLEVSSFHPSDIQLARTGNRFTFSSAVFGENYKSVSQELALNDELYVGLFICSHEEGVVE